MQAKTKTQGNLALQLILALHQEALDSVSLQVHVIVTKTHINIPTAGILPRPAKLCKQKFPRFGKKLRTKKLTTINPQTDCF